MKVRGDLPPSRAFTLEPQPDKPGFVLARFYENAVPYTETLEEEAVTGWEYDEYYLEFPDSNGLEAEIEADYDRYLEMAKNPDSGRYEARSGASDNKEEKYNA